MIRTFCIFTILFFCCVVQAEDPTTPDATAQPKSVAAKQAETKFNLDMQKLDAEYQQKATAVKQTYVDGLKNALKTLAKTDNPDPDEIAKLSAKIKEVQATVVQVKPMNSSPDFKWLVGTTWHWSPERKPTITFLDDHTVRTTYWNGTWSALDAHTVLIKHAEDKSKETVFTFATSKKMVLEVWSTGQHIWELEEK